MSTAIHETNSRITLDEGVPLIIPSSSNTITSTPDQGVPIITHTSLYTTSLQNNGDGVPSTLYDNIVLFHAIFNFGLNELKPLITRNKFLGIIFNSGLNSSIEIFKSLNLNINPNESYQTYYPILKKHYDDTRCDSRRNVDKSNSVQCISCGSRVSTILAKKGYNLCEQHIPKCSATLKLTGKQCASKSYPGTTFCGKHAPKNKHDVANQNSDIITCASILQSGKNIGQRCTAPPKENSQYCGTHNKTLLKESIPLAKKTQNEARVQVKKHERAMLENELIQASGWSHEHFARIKSLRLLKCVYTPEGTMNFETTIRLTNQAIQERFDNVNKETLTEIKSAKLIANEYIRMERCDKQLSLIDAEDGNYIEHFDNRLKMIEECKLGKRNLNKAINRHNIKLNNLPTTGIICNNLPSLYEIMSPLTRGTKVNTEMRHSQSQNISMALLPLPQHLEVVPDNIIHSDAYTPTLDANPKLLQLHVINPENISIHRSISPTLHILRPPALPTTVSKLVVIPEESYEISNDTFPREQNSAPAFHSPEPPFPLDSSEIKNSRYNSDNSGLMNRYNDLIPFVEILIKNNNDPDMLTLAKSHIIATYTKLRHRRVKGLENRHSHLM